jgi:uncharacterized protein (DUF1330 family)
MSALMIIYMTISDESWIEPYFADVPRLLEDYGAVTVAGSRRIERIEGTMPVPHRMAVLRFPSVDAIRRFMADPRYQDHRDARHRGSSTEIFAFENAVKDGELV